jgi:hypothetical protein
VAPLLELLAGSAEGCSKALLVTHGVAHAQIAGLIEAGLATSSTRTVLADRRPVDVTTVRTTDAGRALLERGS